MNRLLIVFLKDARRFRVLLGVWAGSLALHYYLYLRMSPAEVAAGPGSLAFLLFFGSGLAFWISLVLLGMLLVLEDHPGDSCAYWRTQPFRWQEVLAAKFGWCLAVTAIPAVAYTCSLLEFHLGAKALALVFFSEWAIYALAPFCAAAAAVTSETLLRVANHLIIGVLGVGVAVFVTGFLSARAGANTGPFQEILHGRLLSHLWRDATLLTLPLLLSLVVVVAAYRWRARWAIAWGISACLIWILVGSQWPRNPFPSSPQEATAMANPIRYLAQWSGPDAAGLPVLHVTGVPDDPNYMLMPLALLAPQLNLQNGQHPEMKVRPYSELSGLSIVPASAQTAVARVLGKLRTLNPSDDPGFHVAMLHSDPKLVQTAPFFGIEHAILFQIHPVAELPLRPGARARAGLQELKVLSLHRTGARLDVRLWECRPTSVLVRAWGRSPADLFDFAADQPFPGSVRTTAGLNVALEQIPRVCPDAVYVLVNRGRSEILFPDSCSLGENRTFLYQYNAFERTFTFPVDGTDQKWLDGATLVAVRRTWVGIVDHVVSTGPGASQ